MQDFQVDVAGALCFHTTNPYAGRAGTILGGGLAPETIAVCISLLSSKAAIHDLLASALQK